MSTPHHAATIRHVVHIRLDPSLDDERRHSLERDLRHLVDEHPYAVRAALHRDLGRRPAAPVSATWMASLDFVSMAEFESYLASPTHRDFLQTHQPSMAYISAIQVSLEDDGQAEDQSAENATSTAATTSPLRPGAEAQLQ